MSNIIRLADEAGFWAGWRRQYPPGAVLARSRAEEAWGRVRRALRRVDEDGRSKPPREAKKSVAETRLKKEPKDALPKTDCGS